MAEAGPRRLDGVHVLVVEDNEDTRYVLQWYLAHHGAAVTTAPTGREALALVAQVRADVILSDLSMPGMTGIEFIRRVRELPGQAERPTPAIAFSAAPARLHKLDALAAGFQVFLSKPLDPLAVVHEVARLHRDSQET